MTRASPALRRQIRQRAEERCEYCRKGQAFSIALFHADHIIPVNRHLGSNTLDNLAWACSACNNNKSSDIASYDALTTELTPLFNPRTQQWDDHFHIQEGVIIGRTPIGRITVRILDMNEAREVSIRLNMIKTGLW